MMRKRIYVKSFQMHTALHISCVANYPLSNLYNIVHYYLLTKIGRIS